MRFKDIIGLDATKKQLITSKQNGRVAHAQIFCGAIGGGQLALSLAYASYLNCLHPTQTDVCGICSQCRLFLKYNHPDCHFFYPIAKPCKIKTTTLSSRLFLTQWRQLLARHPYFDLADWANVIEVDNKVLAILKDESKNITHKASLKAYKANYKIFLIWLPETMNITAANALLKLLEEPPNKTVFLLVSNDINAVLPTIYSRLQVIYVPNFQQDDVVTFLNRYYPEHSKTEIEHLVAQVQGNLGKALKAVEDKDAEYFKLFRHWMQNCYRRNYLALTQAALKFSGMKRENQSQFFQYSLELMQQVIYEIYIPPEYNLSNRHQKRFIHNFAKTIKPENIDLFIAKIDQSISYIKRYANPKLLFFNLSIESFQLFK